MAYDVGQAYVQILPSTEKFGSTLKSDLGGSTEEAGREAGSKFASGLSTGLQIAGVALSAASAGVVSIAKEVVNAYGDYEQLVGGVQKLFGEMDYQAVVDNASEAFKTAGISANDYMETVTSFSASLIKSLDGDTQKAVEYADMAIRDMSDNANTFGTDIEAIQNAYQGFAKQNYTMLDNLKLGYGGTKTEMERLITDAEKLDSTFQATRDTNGNLALSYSDIIDAIHIVQDNMNITGTTAREAADTIQGSIDTMKAAWENLLTGMGDSNADIDKLTQDFIDSFKNVIDNIEPVIKNMADVLPDVLEAVLDVAAEILPDLIADLLPAAVTGLTKLAAGLITHIPEILVGVVKGLVDGIAEAIGGEKIWDKLFGPSETFQQYSGMLDDLGTSIDNLVSSIQNSTDEYYNSSTAALANADSASYLKDRLIELVDKEDKTVADKELIKQLVGELNKIVPDLALAYDEVTDSLNLTNDEMDRYIDNAYNQAKADAARQYLTDSLYDQYTAQQKLNESNQIFVGLLDKYNVGFSELSMINAGVTNGLIIFKEKIDEGSMAERDAIEAAALLTQAFQDNTEAGEALVTATNNAQFAEEELYKATVDLVGETEVAATTIADQYAQTFGTKIPDELQGAITSAEEAGYKIPDGLITGLSTGDIELGNAINRMNALVQFEEAVSNADVGGAQVGQKFVEAWLSGEFSLQEAQAYWTGMVEFSEAVENAKAGGEEVTAEFINALLEQTGLQGVVSAAEELGKSATPSIVTNEIHEVGASVARETASGINDNAYQAEDAVGEMVDNMIAKTDPLPGEMNSAGNEGGSELNTGWNSWSDTISGSVENVYDYFLHFFCDTLPPMMSTWGSNAGMNLNHGLNNYVPDIQSTVSGIVNDIDSTLAALPGMMEAEGYNGGAGLYNGLVSWEGALFAEAEYIAWNISQTIRNAFNSHSPSRVMMTIGEDVGEGLAIGIEGGGELAIDAAEDVAYDIIDSASHYDYSQIEAAQTSKDKYLEEIVDLLDELRNLKVVMDSGEVVGVLAPGMSDEFERMKVRQGRG